MPSTVNKFINASTFVTATAVYDDADLTIISPDGYYQYNSEYRYQLNGSLGPLVVCASCDDPSGPVIDCGTPVVIPQSGRGLYKLQYSAANTTGAISIYFEPQAIPDGIRVLYDGVYYNRLSSPTDGNRQSTSGIANAFTILGIINSCAAAPQTPSLPFYNGIDAVTGQWIPGTPSPQVTNIYTGDDVLGGANEYNLLIIPKPNATPSEVVVDIVGPCSTTQFNIEVACPSALPSFQGKSIASGTGCTTANATYYFGRFRNQVNTYPELNNPVFNDVNGEFRVLDGNYFMDNSQVITVTNGVVSSIVACS
tara:strand:- start:649 stop:1578 length:930 start_codon:yes stop_codon:yes gene_type:complete